MEVDAEAIKYTSEEDYTLHFFLAKWHDYNKPTVNEINRKEKESYMNLLLPQGLISWQDNVAVLYGQNKFICSLSMYTFKPPFYTIYLDISLSYFTCKARYAVHPGNYMLC